MNLSRKFWASLCPITWSEWVGYIPQRKTALTRPKFTMQKDLNYV